LEAEIVEDEVLASHRTFLTAVRPFDANVKNTVKRVILAGWMRTLTHSH
jgi:hypothetical protein